MNVNDVKMEKPDGDKLELIFEKQKSLMDKYHEIEESQGVGYGLIAGRTFDINEIRSQCLVKDFAWRVTEEVTEATACDPVRERDHLLEELSDAMHFLTEMCIVCQITPQDIADELFEILTHQDKMDALFTVSLAGDKYNPSPYNVIQQLGLAMNCLKQKPWKKTHVLTDVQKFRKHVIFAYHELARLCVQYRSNSVEMYGFYFKKNKVNQFRQESNY